MDTVLEGLYSLFARYVGVTRDMGKRLLFLYAQVGCSWFAFPGPNLGYKNTNSYYNLYRRLRERGFVETKDDGVLWMRLSPTLCGRISDFFASVKDFLEVYGGGA